MREFTWWRRFHGVRKIPKNRLYKGTSELLQRIEFGEYEFNHLGREVYLEDKIFELKSNQIKEESPWLKGETLVEKLSYDRKQLSKRKAAIMKAHLETETKLLLKLAKDLSAEFGLDIDVVRDLMNAFDGTTRELYFKCMSLVTGKDVVAAKIQRIFNEQPRHFLKPKEYKYMSLWIELIKEYKWQSYLNWEQLK